jgi:uncharacterized protein (UPF0276 family)
LQTTAIPWPEINGRPLLGTNGTEAMQSLLQEGEGGLVDYLKVGPFMGQAAIAALRPLYPLLLHLDDTLSSRQPPADEMVGRICGWVELSATPWTSEHIGFSVPDTTLDGALVTQPVGNLLTREEAQANIIRNARALAESLPVPLLLENLPLFPNLAHLHICEPDFVAKVIEETDCGLLLDLAHAQVSANVLGYEVHDYLLRLPLHRTVEIHLSGPRRLRELEERRYKLVSGNAASIAHLLAFDEENLVDAHAPLLERDYALLEWALARTQPQAISLEYYREPEALREQLVRLGEMIGR